METLEKRERILKMIAEWNKSRWIHESAHALLNSGSFFSITRDDFNLWTPTTPRYLYAYIGVENNKLFFIIMDEKIGALALRDMSDDDLNKIVIREFNDDLPLLDFDFIDNVCDGQNLTVSEALSRNLRWQMMKETWIREQMSTTPSNDTGIGRVFIIPFSDFSNIMKNPNINNIAVVTGLRLNGDAEKRSEMYELDLSLWGLLTKTKTFTRGMSLMSETQELAPVEDLSTLSPPYHFRSSLLS